LNSSRQTNSANDIRCRRDQQESEHLPPYSQQIRDSRTRVGLIGRSGFSKLLRRTRHIDRRALADIRSKRRRGRSKRPKNPPSWLLRPYSPTLVGNSQFPHSEIHSACRYGYSEFAYRRTLKSYTAHAQKRQPRAPMHNGARYRLSRLRAKQYATASVPLHPPHSPIYAKIVQAKELYLASRYSGAVTTPESAMANMTLSAFLKV
jgi:hypothetical protein